MTNNLFLYSLIILLFVLLSAFFSAAETALTAISRARIYQLVMAGNWRAKIASRLRREKESLIGTVLLGNTAVNVAASALATSLAITVFGKEGAAVAIVTVLMTLLLVVFSEILPKTYAIQNAERVALALSPVLSLLVKLFYPITYAVQHFIRLLLKYFGVDITKANTFISATDVIRGTIELHHREGHMVKQDRDMLGSILDLNDIEVEKIMVHRKQVETLDAGLPPEKLVAEAVSTMHSRLPVWRGEPDNIIGVLHVKNLVRLLGDRPGKVSSEAILALCHKPWFIPEATSLRDQLLAFRNQRQHLAIVVDEYGGWQGIVTLEDIIEEIVGNIDDEHDEIESGIQRAGQDVYYVNGDVPLRDANRSLGWSLPDEHASTVAGLVIHEAQTIPAAGDHFNLHGFRFTVVGKDARQITRLKIEKLPDTRLPQDVEI
ncbi:MAG: HlyC/CorC family transporter [Pseudomonadota bacterium]|nr:HlyC/CorC family transporter [Pseudomonadota bacterium]